MEEPDNESEKDTAINPIQKSDPQFHPKPFPGIVHADISGRQSPDNDGRGLGSGAAPHRHDDGEEESKGDGFF